MTDQTTYDVAIVGYGPVGVTAANLLGQMGLKVVVVERDPEHLCAGPGHLHRRGGGAHLAAGRAGRPAQRRHAARLRGELRRRQRRAVREAAAGITG